MKSSSRTSRWFKSALVLLALIGSLLSTVSVARQQTPKLGGEVPVNSFRPNPNPPETEAYKIRKGDELDIKVLGEEKLSKLYVVGPDGRITFDFIGSVDASGFTREQLAEKVKARLSDIYYNPLVSVAVTKYSTLKAYVLGQVMKPGLIEFPNDTTLLRALSLAGGVARENVPGQVSATVYSPPETAFIIRNPDTIININLKDLMIAGNRSLDIPIYDDDFIFVPLGKHRRVFVMGEVQRPTVIDLKDDDMDVLGAIGAAGGFTPNASLTNIQLIRRASSTDPNPKATKLDLKALGKNGDLSQAMKLQDQDVILVPKSKMSYIKLALQNGALSFVYLGLQLTGH
jgi:polysaccharide export outer membrane protein